MQNVSIVGKIIRKWEGEKVAYITIACKQSKDVVEFIPVTVFQTDFLKQYFPEKKWIGITGHIHVNEREGKYFTEIIADDLHFVGDKPAEEIPLPWDSL